MNTDNTSNLITGNKCGHDAGSPKIYTQPTFFKKRPALLSRAKYRANGVALGRSWHNPQYLKHYKAQRRHDISLRQQRSEARSRYSQVAGILFDCLDLETLQLGRWDEKTGMFSPYSWAEIYVLLESIQTSTEKFSRDRLYQELRRFSACGYMRIQKRHYETGEVNADGQKEIRQDVAHKWIDKRIFEDLGITAEELTKARKASSERNERLRMAAAVAQCANLPQAKAAEAVVMMRQSAKNGTYSPVRQYFEQKKAQQALSEQARKAGATPSKPQNAAKNGSSEDREAKIIRLMKISGKSYTECEAMLAKIPLH